MEKYYKDIISLMPGHVYWKDKDGVFMGCNFQQAKDAGFNSPDEIIGKTDEDMPWSIQADYLRKIDQQVMRSGNINTLEEIFELPDGTRKLYLSKKLPLYDDNKQTVEILGISFDITERKQLERELILAKQQAEEISDRAKTEFLENMRHDIRTPLTGIVGFADIIKEEAKDPKIKEYANNMVAASYTLLEFLNEVLDAIKVASGELPILKCKFDLKKQVDDIINLMRPKALEKHLVLKLTYDDKIPKYLIGDPKRISRILLELTSNALMFTNEGEVNITLKLVQRDDSNVTICCLVEDTGIGMPLTEHENIFLRFTRLTPSYKGIYKGTGLGLSIVKQFIDDINGEIYCDSELNKGSTFTCLFPLSKALLQDASGVTEVDFLPITQKTSHPTIADVACHQQLGKLP